MNERNNWYAPKVGTSLEINKYLFPWSVENSYKIKNGRRFLGYELYKLVLSIKNIFN